MIKLILILLAIGLCVAPVETIVLTVLLNAAGLLWLATHRKL